MSLLDLLPHIAEVESTWFRRRFAGNDVPKRYQTEDGGRDRRLCQSMGPLIMRANTTESKWPS